MSNYLRLPDAPSLLSDELLYSFVGRLVLLNGLPRPQLSQSLLTGKHLAIIGVDLTCHLVRIRERLSHQAPGASDEDLAERSTLFPYHRAFLPTGRCSRLLQALLHGPAQGLKASIGLSANGFGAATILRYCPQCVREDHHAKGTGYWRRAHHLPGVTACFRHGLSLVSTSAPSRSSNKLALQLPPWDIASLKRESGATAQQLRFARLSCHALESGPPAVTEDRRAAVYQRVARTMGFVGKHGHIAYEQLAEALLEHHGGFTGFEHAQRLLASPRTPLAWLRPLLSRPQRALHPICHLALIDFMFGSWHDYELALRERSTLLPLAVSGTTPEATLVQRDWQAVALDPAFSCRKAAQLTGVSVTTIVTRRRAAGVHVNERRKSLCGPLLGRVRQMIGEGLSPALVAKRTGVSMSTAYRVRREFAHEIENWKVAQTQQSQPAHRQTWCELAQRGLSVKAARRRDPACYAWLYRNDRDWLAAAKGTFTKAVRSSKRVDWNARDREWSSAADAFACAWRERNGRRRLSPTAMSRPFGDWTVRGHGSRLPTFHQQIEKLTQTRSQFQNDRVNEALRAMKEEGIPATATRVLRRAGLRKLPRPM